ncbi:similar to Saccharomyces cerevisiae YPL156C PRM4 Pheromone-regulated protein proposed to be involved in mating [Maudiozyma saulgeensis]|uniref:Similar to Saccharomyces cerevisiae YPL156C PRM4 Pheromone-regulated protein proposed to be involved in mating n=1 Tax=Maudiozyma saulgeensis TaxID=1789683 RepID=A0A1X7R8W3_9SACH|nr:similar to Saccharomyces cerevisiae YPL156C PRM4 Pheromone-regulated protein proposed to be involved in mating [Kazachstania saulgeensis]
MYRGKAAVLQGAKTNRNIFLAILLVTIFGWVLMDNIYTDTDVKSTREDINLFTNFGRHGAMSIDNYRSEDDRIGKNLRVEKEIKDIREKIRSGPSKKPQQNKDMVQNINVAKRLPCDTDQVECNFKEILYNSPVVLLTHSSEDESTHIQGKLHATFETYPQVLVVDMDKTPQGKNLFSYVKSLYKIKDSTIPLLFINGQMIPPARLQEDLQDQTKHSDLLKRLTELGKDNVIIKKKVIPSNV